MLEFKNGVVYTWWNVYMVDYLYKNNIYLAKSKIWNNKYMKVNVRKTYIVKYTIKYTIEYKVEYMVKYMIEYKMEYKKKYINKYRGDIYIDK